MNRNLDVVSFSHPALLLKLGGGGGEGGEDEADDAQGAGAANRAVTVFQNVGNEVVHDIATAGHDATARWVWPGATATAQWLCDRGDEWIRGKRVVELGAGTGLLGEREKKQSKAPARVAFGVLY